MHLRKCSNTELISSVQERMFLSCEGKDAFRVKKVKKNLADTFLCPTTKNTPNTVLLLSRAVENYNEDPY